MYVGFFVEWIPDWDLGLKVLYIIFAPMAASFLWLGALALLFLAIPYGLIRLVRGRAAARDYATGLGGVAELLGPVIGFVFLAIPWVFWGGALYEDMRNNPSSGNGGVRPTTSQHGSPRPGGGSHDSPGAGGYTNPATPDNQYVEVQGYRRGNGTYVAPHRRRRPGATAPSPSNRPGGR